MSVWRDATDDFDRITAATSDILLRMRSDYMNIHEDAPQAWREP